MSKTIYSIYDNSPKTEQISTLLGQNSSPKIQLSGLVGSSISFLIRSLFKKSELPFLLILNDKEEAAYFLNDLEQMVGDQDVLFYPASFRRPYQIEETDNANVLLRAEVLNRINSRKKPAIIVSYPEALFEKVVTRKELDKNTLKVAVGDQISIDFINEVLFEYEFKRVDFITEPGEFSVRGGIVDVFSFSNDNPYRIEFFGNEVDSIRTFDVATQLSLEQQKKIAIIPNVENKFLQENRESFLDYISEKTVLFIQNTEGFLSQLDKQFAKAEEAFEKLSKDIKHATPEQLFLNQEQFIKRALDFSVVELASKPIFKTTKKVDFHIQPQPSFNKQFDLLLNNLNDNHFNGYKNYLFCSNDNQAKRFHDIFETLDEANSENIRKQYNTIVLPLYQGFIDEENQITCYTDHQIFERYHKFSIKNGYSKKQNITLKELTSLSVGDYVTHIDHGIGKFGGLQKIQVEGKTQEAIKLVYADNDIVYVSIHSLHKISRYNGKDGTPPKIYKLGSNAWKVLKQKTKARVKHIAFNLIQLYAKRRLEKGFQYAPDSYLQNELESSFNYEDTPDQIKSTQEVKADMESDRPMDRLVCGDVGFGKTEVAIRAAFKAVDNSKQVAVLVPTTILAYQHYRTFSERLKDMPVTVGYLNRFRTAKQKAETLKQLAEGKLDIVIGTHQLVNKNVVFKDLGLLIVDEEQKFGVNVKDKLKTIAANVDTLTLTATPIPRTLQFSLMAARDLSVITTPPPNRYPIETNVVGFNEELIRDAISYEIQRNGQVFFINKRIENIKEKAFCYFICPPYSAMTDDARKRIQALEQFSELGSGFNIAMKDLEIRGAGDLLGGEQSGFINEIGFDTYQKIMNEAIEELKENEFKDLYPEQNDIETKEYVKDLQLDTDFELLFPDEYINTVSERLLLYNELAEIKDEAALLAYENKLIDRFGPLPKQAISLLSSMKIKWIATRLGIEKLVLKQGKMIGYFVSDQQSNYYQSGRFHQVLQFVQKQNALCKMKEKQTPNGLRLLLTFDNVKSIRRALELIELMGNQ